MVCRRAVTGHAPEYGTMATPVPSATPMARPSVQVPSVQAASESITPLGPAALAARQLNEAEDQMERWSRALQQLRCPNDETVVSLMAHCDSLHAMQGSAMCLSDGHASLPEISA